jgi:hypothetical protein
MLVVVMVFTTAEAQHKVKKRKAQITNTRRPVNRKKETTRRGNGITPVRKTSRTARKRTVPVSSGDREIKAEPPVAVSPDITTSRVVTVTSSFKPSLRNAAKINFTAATPVIDTSKIPLTYNIPSQNLFFVYQPVAIKPVALVIDTNFHWDNDRFIKAGFGNFSTPYLETGLAFGDGKKSIVNLNGLYTSSKGNLPFQQFSKFGVSALGVFNSADHEWISKLYYDNNKQYKYGYSADTTFTKGQLEQQFNSLGFELGVKNKQITDFGITYHPQIKVNYFFDNRNASEYNFLIKAPINKVIGKLFAFDLGLAADITGLNTPSSPSVFHNDLYYISPSLQFNTPNIKLNVGIQPSWDNQSFSVLPDFTVEAKVNEEKFVLQAGWIGYFNKNTYQTLAAFNPYIEQPTTLLNTKVTEQYAGFKGSGGSHFTYNVKFSFLHFSQQPLFVNDIAVLNTQTFKILYEPDLQAIRLHAEVGYTLQERLTIAAGANFTQYTHQQQYDKPWGLLPTEITGTLRYRLSKDILLKSDLFCWNANYYRNKSLQSEKTSAVADMNAGIEFGVLPRLNLWVEFNNLFNNRYQRWNQYEVLGFNVLGGVVYSFQ